MGGEAFGPRSGKRHKDPREKTLGGSGIYSRRDVGELEPGCALEPEIACGLNRLPGGLATTVREEDPE